MDHQTTEQFSGPFRTTLSDHISALQKDFDRHHDLGGLSFAKTWGLASWGPYVASCVSFHPGDMVEYTMTSSERCHLIFNLIDTTNITVEDARFPWQEVSVVLHQKNNEETLYSVLTVLIDQHLHDALDRKVLYSNCCAALLFGDTQTSELAQKAFQRLLSSTNISMELELELSLLEASQNLQQSTASKIERLNQIAISRTANMDASHLSELYDFCSICDGVLIWDSISKASCSAGHEFSMKIPCFKSQ